MSIEPLSAAAAIELCERLIAFAVVLQTVELLSLRKTFDDHGVWRWQTIRPEFEIFSRPMRMILDATLPYRRFMLLLSLRLLVAAGMLAAPSFAQPFTVVVLLISTLLVAVRWRGTFNGGSDSMTVVVLSALTVAEFFSAERAALYYIALQLCCSYLIAGIAKLKQPEWRTGAALVRYLHSPLYRAPDALKARFVRPRNALFGAWTILVFECVFPIALAGPALCTPFLAAALLFHLINVYAFGLNRFFWAWSAAYPALYWASLSW